LNNKQKLELLIKSIMSDENLTQEDISLRCGYKAQTITQNLSSGKVTPRLLAAVEKEFKIGVNKNNAMPKTASNLQSLINHNNNLIDAHKDVASANKATAEANKLSASTTNELAIANKELAKTNSELTVMLKNSINSNGQNSHQNLAEKVLHRIAEKGVPELWPTKQEGLDKLNKYLIGAPPDITESNKQQKAGKSSIS
jgi:transcriptional regulator with XRE-family HTH domain